MEFQFSITKSLLIIAVIIKATLVLTNLLLFVLRN